MQEYAAESEKIEQDYDNKAAILEHQTERHDRVAQKYNDNTNHVVLI